MGIINFLHIKIQEYIILNTSRTLSQGCTRWSVRPTGGPQRILSGPWKFLWKWWALGEICGPWGNLWVVAIFVGSS